MAKASAIPHVTGSLARSMFAATKATSVSPETNPVSIPNFTSIHHLLIILC